jgi:PAS domain S-box-containing protein
MFVAFAIFILACGGTHLFDLWTVWNPDYWLLGGVKAVTAVASVTTAILLVKLVPGALLIPSQQQVTETNTRLKEEIAAREQVETHLRRTQERFQTMIETAPDAIVIVNNLGAIVLVNSQAEKLFGYQREELLGRKIEMLIPERYAGTHPVYRDGFLADPRVRPMGAGLELLGQRKDGLTMTEQGIQGERAIAISVTDTGVGIFPEDQAKLFVAFSRVNVTNEMSGEGTGLGLQLSQKLAELLGGRIGLHSEYGKGSTFTLVLPER